MTINVKVNKTGFYHSILTYQNDSTSMRTDQYSGIEWSGHLLTYNFSAIKNDYHHQLKDIQGVKPTTITVSQLFHFKDSCALLDFDCRTVMSPTFTIGHLKHRWDIIVLIFIIYFLCVILSVAFVITTVALCLKLDKCRKCQL